MTNHRQQKRDLLDALKTYRHRLARTDDMPDEETIHKIRVLTKRVRAEATLWGRAKSVTNIRKEAKKLARCLAPTREAQVMRGLFEQLFAAELEESAALRDIYQALLAEEAKTPLSPGKLTRRLRSVQKGVKRVNLKVIKPVAYPSLLNRAQSEILRCYTQLKPEQRESYHDWRKAVKAYLFLAKVEPGFKADRRHKQLKVLGEKLGLLHDLHQLDDWLAMHGHGLLPRHRAVLDNYEEALKTAIAKKARQSLKCWRLR